MIALVTGASGFVGGALARELLGDRNRVVALVRDGEPPIECVAVRGELEDLRACERVIVEHQPDVVFHLAAQAMVGPARRDPWSTMESNVRGTYNLLEAYRRHRKPGSTFIMASSDKAYGEGRWGLDEDGGSTGERRPYHEDDSLEGIGPYDVSKSCADLLAQSYARSYGLNLGIIRAGNIYGPGDSDLSRVVPSFVEDLIRERPVSIMSDGTPVRDYLYVDDAVSGYTKLWRYLRGHEMHGLPVNIAGGEPCSVRQLADTFIEMLVEQAKDATRGRLPYVAYRWLLETHPTMEQRVIVHGSRTGEIQHQVLDCRRARRLIGWEPRVTLREGLRLTAESRCKINGQ